MVDYIPLLEFLCDIVNGEVDFFYKLIGLRLRFLGDLIFVDYQLPDHLRSVGQLRGKVWARASGYRQGNDERGVVRFL